MENDSKTEPQKLI